MTTAVTFSRHEIEASICRSSFYQFVKRGWHTVPGCSKLVDNWHIAYLCEILQEIAERVMRGERCEYDTVFNVPPGTSKSTISSILFPAWVWTKMPDARFICASHTDSLVLDLADRSREVVRSDWYRTLFPGIGEPRDNKDAKGDFANIHGGERKSCTVGGKTPTGRHAHVLLVDDPIDPQRVLSIAELKTAAHFLTNVLPTRKADKAVTATVLIMQRLGVGDPTEVMLKEALKEGAMPVKHVCLPSDLEPNGDGGYEIGNVSPPELASRYINGLLDPNRLGPIELARYRARGALFFSTQFRQKPYAVGGGMFQEGYFNKRIKVAPYQCKRVRYWDRACLLVGSLINTKTGPKPIEDIRKGDQVLTRKGWRAVTWAGMTKIVDGVTQVGFSNGSTLRGTADHLVWTTRCGWYALGNLRVGEECLTADTNGKIILVKVISTKFKDCGYVPVYDLTVRGAHEFFAEGILVHNSSVKDGSCRTAGVLMGKDGDGNLYVEHVVVGRWEPKERYDIMRATALRDRAKYGPKYEPEIWIEAEGGSSGRDAWRDAAKSLQGFNVREQQISGMGNKVFRAEPWSAQLAAGMVYIVDNGEHLGLGTPGYGRAEWDINDYISEHCGFPLAELKDTVDGSSGCLSILCGGRQVPTGVMRVLHGMREKYKGIHLLVCPKDMLADALIDGHPALLICFKDPMPGVNGELPAHAVNTLVGSLVLHCADLDPADHQATWDSPITPYGEPAGRLVANESHGKKLWSFLMKTYPTKPEVYVFTDDGDRRALSAACAVADVLRLPRSSAIYVFGQGDNAEEETEPAEPGNQHLYEVLKRSRGLVL